MSDSANAQPSWRESQSGGSSDATSCACDDGHPILELLHIANLLTMVQKGIFLSWDFNFNRDRIVIFFRTGL